MGAHAVDVCACLCVFGMCGVLCLRACSIWGSSV